MGFDSLSFLSRGEIWIAGSAIVAFLILTWALRGAPPGQAVEAEEDAEAPRAGYRDRIVAAVVVGLILILAGAFVSIERGILWSLPMFGLGFGLVLTLMVVNQRYRHGSPTLRRTIDFANTFLNASLLAGILVVVNVIAFRYAGQPLDLTREGTYSLSSTTLKQLTSLDRPLTFSLVFGRGPRAIRQRDRVVQLVESYKAVNPRMIQIVNVDQFFDQARLDELGKRVPELELIRGGGGLVMELGDGTATESVVVRSQELFHPVGGDALRAASDRFESTFTGEDEITSALIRLREGEKSKVAFTTGHGERSTVDLNPGGAGIGNWKSRLTKVGCEVIDLNLIQDVIPRELKLLIVVGPKSPFKPEELLKLKAYAIEGRPILLLLGNNESSGLEELLKSFNLEIGKGLLIDPKLNYNRNPALVFAPLDGGTKHPIVDAMGTTRAVLLASAAPIHVLGRGPNAGANSEVVNREMIPSVLVRGSKFGWGETDLKNAPPRFDLNVDERGPVTVGVAVTHRGSANPAKASESQDSPRLVLFSSAAMADTLGLAAKTHVALTLTADPVLQWRLILVPTVTSLLVIIGLGILVFIARRE
jgi:ABC-type uncharacterized transport system